MQNYSHPADVRTGGRAVSLCIGVFDGVHLGHQQVIAQTLQQAHKAKALPLVVTFDRHPNEIVAPAKTPPLIYGLSHKLAVLGGLGVEATLVSPFDAKFASQTGSEFIQGLLQALKRIDSIFVGHDFVFGKGRTGDLKLLKQMGQDHGFAAAGVNAITMEDEIVSSTRIRQYLSLGDLAGASRMLGRSYSIRGPVQEGRQLGRTLSFPTANLTVKGLALPSPGVYCVQCIIDDHLVNGVANLGMRPTVTDGPTVMNLEVHLLNFSSDIYGQVIEVIPQQKLREERRFASIQALRDRISADVKKATAWFARPPVQG